MFLGNDIGIDLGTASVLVYCKGQGIVLQEPSVVAIDDNTNSIVAVGEEARKMLGKTPDNIVAIRPLREGVISNFEVTERMIRYFIGKSVGFHWFKKPRIAVCVPSKVTDVERRAVEQATKSAGADNVKFMWETSPVEYVGRDGRLEGLKVMNNDNEFIIPADKVLVAIGSKPAKRIISTTKGIEVNDNGYLITKEKPYGMTTLNGVFAGGDVVHQPATVVLAMKEAKKVVAGIASYVDAVKLLGYKREDIQN